MPLRGCCSKSCANSISAYGKTHKHSELARSSWYRILPADYGHAHRDDPGESHHGQEAQEGRQRGPLLTMAERGRPSIYTPKIAAEICRRMEAGESLRSICRSKDMPDEATVRLWARENREGFYPQYARAMETRMEGLADEILEIADDKSGDAMRDRLRLDARKWLMRKVAPKRWGDRTIHMGDPDAPLVVEKVVVEFVKAKD